MRERERGGRKRLEKRGGRRSGGEGVAQRTDDVVVTHPKSLQISLSSQQRAGPERKQNGQAGKSEGGKGTAGRALNPTPWRVCIPPPPLLHNSHLLLCYNNFLSPQPRQGSLEASS